MTNSYVNPSQNTNPQYFTVNLPMSVIAQVTDSFVNSSSVIGVLLGYYTLDDVIVMVGHCLTLDDIDTISQNLSYELMESKENHFYPGGTDDNGQTAFEEIFNYLMELFNIIHTSIRRLIGRNHFYFVHETTPILNSQYMLITI